MLVDDHEVVRDGLKALIQANDDLVVVAEAGSVKEALLQADRTKPDVIVMDVRLADGSGIEATREIRAVRPQTRVLMLTSFADDDALDHGRRRRIRPQADQGQRAAARRPHRWCGPE